MTRHVCEAMVYVVALASSQLAEEIGHAGLRREQDTSKQDPTPPGVSQAIKLEILTSMTMVGMQSQEELADHS